MRHIPGWVVGALGTAAVVASFYAGGGLNASSAKTAALAETSETAEARVDTSAVEVDCEPGQRAIVRAGSATTAGSVACVSITRAPTPGGIEGPARATRVAYTPQGGYAQPAVMRETVEVYRPQAVVRPTRSVKKSAVIIASSTAAGAVVGGLVNGKKGALVGGIVSGGAATVWDQVTRRRHTNGR